MRRFLIIFLLLMSLAGLCLPASAASGATSVQIHASVLADGSAQVSVTVRLHLDEGINGLTFPIPSDARNVFLNGATVRTYSDNSRALVLLPNMVSGDSGFTISYQLPQVVNTVTDEDGENPKLMLQLPLLSGFQYPISSLEMSVTLPDTVPSRPGFSSGYHQQGIEANMEISWLENTISVKTTKAMKDHETLQLNMQVLEDMFPQVRRFETGMNGWEAATLVFAALAILYYFLCLLPVIPRRVRCFAAPEGISAGEVGTCITGSGMDLTMLIFSWAQLGYIRMELTHKDKVTLHKRMDMGNERSSFEVRVFQDLFHGRRVVAGSSYHYARMCRKVAASSPLQRQLYKASSGNPKIFQALALVSGALSGLCLAVSVTDQIGLQTLLGILFGPLFGFFSYCIQAGSRSLPLRDKSPLLLGTAACGLWLLLAGLLGSFWPGLLMVLFQLLCGIAAAYGGRRTERGKQCLAQVNSLRRFMLTTSGAELQRMLKMNPNYFYELAPYALAMGVDRQFARKFGHMILPDCSFLITSFHRELTAQQLMSLMRRAANSLNALQKRMPYDKLRGK